MTTPQANRDQIAAWLPLFFGPDDVLEIRALGVGRPGRKVAGWMTAANVPAMARSIAAVANEPGASVYFTPHRLNPVVLQRARNVLVEVGPRLRLTADADVLERRYLLIDVDPVRPAGVSATDAEKSHAREVADRVRERVNRHAPGGPLVVDSGNGFHLYYRLPDPETGGTVADPAADRTAVILHALAQNFDTAAATIDTSVFNPSRIMKVPGTVARKGEPTPERPHRPCVVVEVPNGWQPVG